MKTWLHKILSSILEEIATRLIGVVMLAAWLLVFGLSAGCIWVFDSQSHVIVVSIIIVIALVVPVWALWKGLQKGQAIIGAISRISALNTHFEIIARGVVDKNGSAGIRLQAAGQEESYSENGYDVMTLGNMIDMVKRI